MLGSASGGHFQSGSLILASSCSAEIAYVHPVGLIFCHVDAERLAQCSRRSSYRGEHVPVRPVNSGAHSVKRCAAGSSGFVDVTIRG